MNFLYQIGIQLASFLLPVTGLFSAKMKLFVEGRKNVFSILEEKINKDDQWIWMHVASLGEYEQGLPVMEQLKQIHPEYKIVLTFFSPSGFEIRKNNKIADITLYLPLDTRKNVKRFLNLVNPVIVFFIKYEFWPNYLNELGKRKIPTYLVSGIFRPAQLFFKSYGGFYRQALKAFSRFFVQNDDSLRLLQSIGFTNVTVNGDTRFDRVAQIVDRVQPLDFIAKFREGIFTIVIGSSWPEDEEVYLPLVNEISGIKWIIAPHNIKTGEVTALRNKINRKTVLFSNRENEDVVEADVFIIDTIGILTSIYAYADIAYVGGGFKTGLHNILEPATFGIPVIIGPKYAKFQEAKDLVKLGSCLVVNNTQEFSQILLKLKDNSFRKELGSINKAFILQNKNATQVVMESVFHTQKTTSTKGKDRNL